MPKTRVFLYGTAKAGGIGMVYTLFYPEDGEPSFFTDRQPLNRIPITQTAYQEENNFDVRTVEGLLTWFAHINKQYPYLTLTEITQED